MVASAKAVAKQAGGAPCPTVLYRKVVDTKRLQNELDAAKALIASLQGSGAGASQGTASAPGAEEDGGKLTSAIENLERQIKDTLALFEDPPPWVAAMQAKLAELKAQR